jgi:putative aldouronate transport system permease protein
MYGTILAFKNYSGVGGFADFIRAPNVGFMHFKNFFSSIYFGRLLGNTLILSGLRLLIVFPAPIILALLINEIQNTIFKRTVQTISYLPYFLSWVVVSGLIMTLLSPDDGPLNSLLQMLFGSEPQYFIAKSRYFRPIIIISDVWKSIGWGSIIYLAAISNVSQEMYEAATMDGARKWHKIFYITLPAISEIIAVMFILQIGRILDQNFDQIFNLYSASIYDVSDVFDTYVYRAGVGQAQYSYATAVGLFKSVVSLFLVWGSNAFSKKLGSEGLW